MSGRRVAAWVSVPGGDSLTYGTVPAICDAFDAELCCEAGEIRLPLGDIAMGSVHLNAPTRRFRFAPLSPEAFVHRVTSAYDQLWLQRGRGSLLLVRREGRRAAVISLARLDGYYAVVTAFPLSRDHNPRRRREVCMWTRG